MNSEVEVPSGSVDRSGITGEVEILLTREEDSDIVVVHHEVVRNLVTDVGDQYYAERAAAGIAGSPLATGPSQATGMRLGTSTTAAAKNGAGAAIVTYLTASNTGLVSGYPTSSKPAAARRITWQSTWAAGTATNPAITEAVVTNETGPTNVAGTAANTISRVVFTAVDKGALDTLTITWSHDILGA